MPSLIYPAPVEFEQAAALLREWGEPSYRVTQLRQAVMRDLVASWDDLTTFPQALRERLAASLAFAELHVAESQRASDGTEKARFETSDGFPVEAVLMRHGPRITTCISSQSGCALACSFCATGTMGLGRNLTSGMLMEQLIWAQRIARAGATRVGNVVLMGMGEPFMNYDAVLDFCRQANDPAGFGLGARHIAISTAGWVPGIARLAEEPLQLKLALSLHAPNDELRSELMPVTKRFPVAEVLAACRTYREASGRRVFVEYVLLDGVNDSTELADETGRLLNRYLPGGAHVNLIAYNATDSEYRGSDQAQMHAFRKRLELQRIPATIRISRGRTIDAACGQLAVKGVRDLRAARRRERAERRAR